MLIYVRALRRVLTLHLTQNLPINMTQLILDYVYLEKVLSKIFFYKTKWDYENKVSIAESKKCTQKVRGIYAALQEVFIRNI